LVGLTPDLEELTDDPLVLVAGKVFIIIIIIIVVDLTDFQLL
jgi:hypothetical protein